MSFLLEFISAIADEVRWQRQIEIERRIAFGATALMALLFVGAAVATAVLRALTGRQDATG